jgi:2,3-bisphosphoglycerate-independent phosphoglycerate mutase
VPSLAGAVSKAGWTQFHVAETEKYAHVTYFFNGGREEPWPGEDRKLVPSIKTVATYDLQPTMAAEGVCDALVEAIDGGKYDLIVANFANPDMVGHTGVWDATIKACETVDAASGASPTRSWPSTRTIRRPGRRPLHHRGPRQRRRDEGRGRQPGHQALAQPGAAARHRALHGREASQDGRLADVTPTILEIGGLEPWPEVTGHSLLAKA